MEERSMERLRAQISFLLAADGLKRVDRTCHIGDGSRRENGAEHSWHVTLMAMVLAEHCGHPVNLGRVLELLTIHDLVEVYAGDTLVYDETAVLGQAEREAAAASKIFGLLPDSQRDQFLALWSEFEDRQTPEGSYARAIDCLAPTWIHWGEHSVNRNSGLRASQVIEHKQKYLEQFPVLFDLLKGIVGSAVDRGLIDA